MGPGPVAAAGLALLGGAAGAGCGRVMPCTHPDLGAAWPVALRTSREPPGGFHPPVGCGHTWPSPRPQSERATPQHHAGGVMPGDPSSPVAGLQGPLPARPAPDRGPARVNGNHRDLTVGGHLDQPVAKLPGRDASHGGTEPLAATAATEPLPAGLPSIGEVEVFDAD